MVQSNQPISPEQLALLRWTVRLGVVTADALAVHGRWTLASARARLQAAESKGLLCSRRLLAGCPALYTATGPGLRASGLHGFEACRVSVAGAPHAIECARVAAALEQAYPDHHVMGERELRREEREAATPLASALLGRGPGGTPLLHRPDLVLWPQEALEHQRLPVAVEVELTIKAPRRLLEICRAWARSRCVAGVLYLVAPNVERPLARAIAQAHAAGRIAAVPIAALTSGDGDGRLAADSTVPGDA
jgi:hypothetical protein